MSDEALREEVTDLCRELIRIDTSNPPGRETPAAELLVSYLERAGVSCELVGPDPERLNLIARLEGAGEGPSLMLLGHTDVVPAPAHGWSVPPFEGVVSDGSLIGRGAADMKGELAARAVALAARARSGGPPAGDVVLVAESDEERGLDDVGITWLLRERPDVRCDFALNEGGGNLLELADGRKLVTVGIGEKVVSSVRLRVSGRGGHASTPLGAENPLEYAAEAIRRLSAARAPRRPVPAVAAALEQLGVADLDDDALVAWARSQHPLLAAELDAMLRLTVTPTGVNSFEPANVIPPYVDITCDCRALPGDDLAAIEAHVARALEGGPAYELELLEPLEGGTASPLEGPLFEAIEAWVAERVPGATLLPMIGTGFSDSAFVRKAFDTVAYGFAPILHTDPDVYYGGIHSADEQIAIDDLAAMTSFNLAAIEAVGAAAPA